MFCVHDSKFLKIFKVRHFFKLIVLKVLVFLLIISYYKHLNLISFNNDNTKLPATYNTKTKTSNPILILSKDALIKKLIHVFYVHHIDTSSAETKGNFKFFMNFAYAPCVPNVFFTLIFNRDDTSRDINEVLKIHLGESLSSNLIKCIIKENGPIDTNSNSSIRANTKVISRQNEAGPDLCAIVETFRLPFWTNNLNLFSYFIFINSSARGPFLPEYYFKKW